jgi:Xaa-Pro aminopeptidase
MSLARRTLILAAALIAVGLPGPAAADDLQDDLKARRARLMERVGPTGLLILRSAPERTYSNDIEYEYRQDSNLYYLTAIDQPDTTLVLMPGNATRKEILFISERDPVREHWDGHRLSPAQATERTGIDTVRTSAEFERFLASILSRVPFGVPRNDASGEYDVFFRALDANEARVWLVLEPQRTLAEPPGPMLGFANALRDRFMGFAIRDATAALRDLRQVKTAYEQKVLERSLQISSEAHRAGMRAARPGAFEYEVEAAIERVYLAHGALGWGYPSIVGSGPNATILHYNKSRRQLQDGDLQLVDAAANYDYMTGDITRTYPVNGVFSPAQKDIYRVVLAAQEAGMEVARIGGRIADIEGAAADVVRDGLFKLGLVTDPKSDQFRIWYTHGIVHFIGLDVHDVGDRTKPIEAGWAFVIEPGLYIRDGALENLPPTPANHAFAEKVRPAFEKYRNIGVRIEDSFLMTPAGLKRLSTPPRTIEEIELFMKESRR